ncbi:adenylate/guanylate cyclase domain-containing protein [Lacibacter sp. H375]|uniref:adenylate/guanylate cyclase domain-containing protein n=1 Tax=Lacibacter sp. H375 TaxID=3133424 RepID=UPI0030BA5944
MKNRASSYSLFSGFVKYKLRNVLYIALAWTIIDSIVILLMRDEAHITFRFFVVRESAVFIISCFMGYLFVFALRNAFPKQSPFLNFVLKSFSLILAAFLISFLVPVLDSIILRGKEASEAMQLSINDMLEPKLLFRRILYWVVLLVITQLYMEINEKYSPGVFIDIIRGKYMQPKIEKRIVMFMDLKDSTPIAEKLGHVENFKFIRDFIFDVSMALIEHDGRIYQYVGDEIVVSWLFSKRNAQKCLNSIIDARKNLQKNGEHFRRRYNIIPEFRVGLHMGEVTVGQIGVIKKDLAMSGDTMNTTARIRSACTELNQKFIMSKNFMENSDLTDWQGESLGIIDLKGKAEGIELFSIKI